MYKGEAISIEVRGWHEMIYSAYFISKTGRKGVLVSPMNEYGSEFYGPRLPKISLLTENIATTLQRTIAFGLQTHWQDQAIEQFVPMLKENVPLKEDMVIDLDPPPNLSPLTMSDMKGGFLVPLIFMGISMLVFLCEILIGRHHMVAKQAPAIVIGQHAK